jgi:chromosome segregation protein
VLVRRLEINGFKSFAERAIVEFGPGATGIVGPNGTGKSNITDAIRWALGEQNPRMLRSSRMEDIIFNGSETRKPLGFAEVILTVDNADGLLPLEFAEISITRRLYRSGESEYLLNGSPARLRDITDLLANTCLGREGYSLIGQGRIDEVLMSTPESRRGLFDEACGIGLHRGRKREALARLGDVAGRLERVSDVTTELESQLTPLDRQAVVARAFVGYRDELERLELWLEGQGLDRLRMRIKASRERLTEIRGQDVALRERHKRLEEETRTLRAAHNELGALVEQKQREASLSEAALRQLAGRIEALERSISDRQREATLIREERERLGERLARAAARQTEMRTETAARKDRQTAIRVELSEGAQAEAAARQTLNSLRTAVETAKSELLEVVSQAGACRYELSTKEAEIARLRLERDRLRREAETTGQELANLGVEAATLAGRLAQVEPETAARAGTLSELENGEVSLGSTLTGLGGQAERERESVAELETERASLEVAIVAASAWSRSALAVVTAAREAALRSGLDSAGGGGSGSGEWAEGLVGVLGEELDVKPGERLAFEAALGRYVDALVVRTEADLRRYITFLKGEELGPAVIIPLDLVSQHLVKHGARGGHGRGSGGAWLANRVECAEELRPVVDYLLGDTLLAQDYEEALTAVTTGRSSRAVTLEGLLVRPGGAVALAAGGAGRERARRGATAPGDPAEPQTLKRMRRLREVRAELETRRARLARLSAEREASEKSLSEVRSQRSRLTSDVQKLTLERTALSGRLEDARRREAAARQKVEKAGLDQPELGQSLLLLEAKIRDFAGGLRQHAATEERLRTNLSGQEAAVRAAEEVLATTGGRLGELRVQAATLEERERADAAESTRLADEVARLSADEARLAARLAVLDEERDRARAELEPLRRRQAAAKATETDAGPVENVEAWRTRRRELAGDLEGRESEVVDLRTSLDELVDRERREETRLARFEAEDEMTTRRLRRDWGDDWEEKAARATVAAGERGETVLTEEAGQARVEELRRAMSGLGVVNIGAIEEHRRLSERAEFLRSQAKDLVDARESLLRLIGEMDESMAKRFEEGFLAVRRAFRDKVPDLFGGGRGDLILTNRDNLLESGVEILVEPPSKRLQSLALLSAGERALSALALLLSFLEVRPSPFVVLDEIDAPLDDANVARFCVAVVALTALGRTQFVIVTHNKATMEIADSLYGVTMGEDGVSRLVSVKLEDREELRRRLAREAS